MTLQIGIVGLPNVGKSTLFNALTQNKVEASNYPFCTIDPNVGVVKVPDERLEKLAIISKSKKILPTTIEFVDIAGLVKGASSGEGLGNKFLSHIRECDAICEVIRDFEDDDIVHVNGSINVKRDKETINLELIIADIQSIEKQLEKISKDTKSKDKKEVKKYELLKKIKRHLDKGGFARDLEFDNDDMKLVKRFNLLTIKPIIYVINATLANNCVKDNIKDNVIFLNIKQEEEISYLLEEEKKEFITELGLEKSGLEKLIQVSYKLLGLITFLTTGFEETKAWTIKKGIKAPEASSVIHTDFEKNFIRVEVINWKKFIKIGGDILARKNGLIKTEGKEYIMQDGDVCNFLINK